jgi:hypothetical protein
MSIPFKKIFLPLSFLILGAGTTVWSKLQDSIEIKGYRYKHPFIQTTWYFFGQMLLHLVVKVKPYLNKNHAEEK